MNRPERALPWAPRPFEGEALGSWLGRLAAAYGMTVDEFVAYAGLSVDLGGSGANWLALPEMSPGDRERLAALCRLAVVDLPAACKAGTATRLGYCHRCLYLNPLDVTAPYWRASWLVGTDDQRCATHEQCYERTSLAALRQHRNMKSLLHFISRAREARQRAAAWQHWTLAWFAAR